MTAMCERANYKINLLIAYQIRLVTQTTFCWLCGLPNEAVVRWVCPTFKHVACFRDPPRGAVTSSFHPAQTHSRTSARCWANTETITRLLSLGQVCPEVWFKVFHTLSLPLCLVSALGHTVVQRAIKDQPEYLRCNNTIIVGGFRRRRYRLNARRTSVFLPALGITFTGNSSFITLDVGRGIWRGSMWYISSLLIPNEQ